MAYVRETGTVLGDFAVASVVGSSLGAAHAKWGLDTPAGPLDGWVMGASAVASVVLSGYSPEVAAYARKIGTAAASVLTFRKSYEVVKHEPLPGGAKLASAARVQRIAAPGTIADDPIERIAKALG
jgi:hypothetical protein